MRLLMTAAVFFTVLVTITFGIAQNSKIEEWEWYQHLTYTSIWTIMGVWLDLITRVK